LSKLHTDMFIIALEAMSYIFSMRPHYASPQCV